MSITADFHLHSSFSEDCNIPMEEMIQAGIAKGLTAMCFTEHNDFDFPKEDDTSSHEPFLLNVDSYLYELLNMRKKYQDRIRILFGIEIGLQQSCLRKNIILSKSHDFDFIIASSHLCQGKDPYYPSFFEGRDVRECYRLYFEEMLANVKSFLGFDVYGHLDYIARYAPPESERFLYADYRDIIDEILKTLIHNEKAIECNTSGLRKPFNATNPCPEIIRRYRELGGEIITVGSDAHTPSNIAADFDKAAEVLKDCGFQYYATFEGRQPSFHKL
ncbi:MAG: histidinol-phosphatase HisJ family protein [Lachnospiraceae bacterium]